MRRLIELSASFAAGLATAGLIRTVAPRVRAASAREASSGSAPTVGEVAPSELDEAGQPGRGRDAARPSEIPARGWKDILVRTGKEFGDDQIALIAAGCTFYALLALFPGIAAFVSLYGLFADVAQAQRHIEAMSAILPAEVIALIADQMVRLASAREGGLSFAFLLGLGTALWSANKAMKALITGLNIAYDEKEARGFVAKTLVPLGFTLGLIVFALIAAALGAIGAVLDDRFGSLVGGVYTAAYWILLFLGVVSGMAVLYRFGPSRSRARWRWITWGSGLAAVAWVVMSGGFTLYVARFGNYDETYGALGAVIGFMTWTWLSSMVFLMGAELNAEIEHQTAKDTTTGAPQPIGTRGAVMADTIGEAR